MRGVKWYLVVIFAVLITVVLFALAYMLTGLRPDSGKSRLTAEEARAAGKCAQCHRRETPAIVETFEKSPHAEHVNCLDCHKPLPGQEVMEHKGFEVVRVVTAGNCAECHAEEYREFTRSRHGAPAWTAVMGKEAFTRAQYEYAYKYHPEAMDRGPNALGRLEGIGAVENGCGTCHEIGAPNADGSVGNCNKCHLRHYFSVEEAREPETCGACHLGPDHSQIEIYEESSHGIVYRTKRDDFNLKVEPARLTTDDMPAPTCSTCHLSGLNGGGMTHDVGQRLSYYLFAAISTERPGGTANRERMKELCLNCHAETHVEEFYADADLTLAATNDKVAEVKAILDGLYADGILTPEPFDEPVEFEYFDFWHYFGRTAKHGAYMGGADYVQWHGNYELLLRLHEFQDIERELRGLE
jgi:hypothetical protein